ncbi:MAG TPA: glycerophosphodiester phosphodiesterase [Propionibacteriaceae bacterium]|nr:glycerophosphodiester phosphodiesterase [Propionibacteriaceae bacterium]
MVVGVVVVFAAAVWLNNTSAFTDSSGAYKLLAHRGLAQTFDISAVTATTNTARVIDPPQHPYLENTMASIAVSFDTYKADVVELDVQRTKDGKLALFHDADLAERTDGTGPVSDHTMAELRKVDVGYGYTADDGKTYPFRGKGVGLMPEFGEVLAAFPGRDLLIHMQHGDLETAKILWTYLKDLPPEWRDRMSYYGNEIGLKYLRDQEPNARILTAAMIKSALLQYELLGWTGYVPAELHNMELHIPIDYARYLWGWPEKFVQRMDAVNTRVVLVEGDGDWSEGFDTPQSLSKVPEGFTGYVWTNRIDLVADR